jgi:hypothetical protein
MAVPELRIGGVMEEYRTRDDEFERRQRFFRPARVRKLLTEYHAIHDPWLYQDESESGMIYRTQRINPEPGIFRLADLKASIDWAMHRLSADDPLAHMVITGLYVDRAGWNEVSADTGLPVLQVTRWDVTVGMVEQRGVDRMAKYLGWKRDE